MSREDAPDLREIYPLRTCDNCDYNLVCYDIDYKFKNRCTKYDFIVINGDRFVCNDWEEGETEMMRQRRSCNAIRRTN